MAENPERKPLELKIQVNRIGEDIALPTTGAMGGVNPDGETITAHLYYETRTIASATYHPLSDDGVADLTVIRGETDSHLTRSVHTSIILSPHAARIIGEWLIQKSLDAKGFAEQLEEE